MRVTGGYLREAQEAKSSLVIRQLGRQGAPIPLRMQILGQMDGLFS